MTKFAAVQMQIAPDMQTNYEKSLRYISEAAAKGAECVIFPEGQLSHYVPQYQGRHADDYAIAPDHPYIRGFQEACKRERIIASLGLCLEIEGCVYAADMLISEAGEILAIGKKNHIVQVEHFYEQDYFTAGDEGFQVVDTSIGRIGIIVCFDRHYPEGFRTCVLKGADFIVVPVANERIEPNEIFQWEIRIPAFQNSTNIVMCNRVGVEGDMDFCGGSFFANPDGSVAAIAGGAEELLIVDMDLTRARRIREEKQYLTIRRPEVFEL